MEERLGENSEQMSGQDVRFLRRDCLAQDTTLFQSASAHENRQQNETELTPQQDPRKLPRDLWLLLLEPIPVLDVEFPEVRGLAGNDGGVSLGSGHGGEFAGDGSVWVEWEGGGGGEVSLRRK